MPCLQCGKDPVRPCNHVPACKNKCNDCGAHCKICGYWACNDHLGECPSAGPSSSSYKEDYGGGALEEVHEKLVIKDDEEETAPIEVVPNFDGGKRWDCEITMLGAAFPIRCRLAAGPGLLRGTIFHDIEWVGARPPICYVSRKVESTTQVRLNVANYEFFEQDARALRPVSCLDLTLLGCSPFHIVHVYDNESVMSIVLKKVVQDCLNPRGKCAGVNFDDQGWDGSCYGQLFKLCGEMSRNKVLGWTLLDMWLRLHITKHNHGGEFYRNAVMIPPCTWLRLDQIVKLYRKGGALDGETAVEMGILWCWIAELCAAWQSASIGAKSVYDRLTFIDIKLTDILKMIAGCVRTTELPLSDWQPFYAGMIEIRRWVTSCRTNLNIALRPVIQYGRPIEPGNRWDVIKDQCPIPLVNPFSNKAPISDGGSASEAYTAMELVKLPRFKNIQRYLVFNGPSPEEISAFKFVLKTIAASKLEKTVQEALILWVNQNLKKWGLLVKCIEDDALACKKRSKDVRNFSIETINFAAELYETCPNKGALIQILPVKGGTSKDGEYWDKAGFPWDQKCMFDPASMSLSFEGAVMSFCNSVVKQCRDAANGKIFDFGGKPCLKMGIVLDCTYVGRRVYEGCWGELYNRFDSGTVPFLLDGQPLLCEIVASQGLVVQAGVIVTQEKMGILWQFDEIARRGARFAEINQWLFRFAGSTLLDLVRHALPGSWDCYRDYVDAIDPPGLFRELPFSYAKDSMRGLVGRILVDTVGRRIYVCPLHYNRYTIPLNGIDGDIRPHLAEVDLGDDAQEFWAKIK